MSCHCTGLNYCEQCVPVSNVKERPTQRWKGTLIDEHPVSRDGLTRGSVDYSQRRVGSKVYYEVWLEQGLKGCECRELFIAESEIDGMIKFLEAAKISIQNNKEYAAEAGHRI